MVLICWTWLSGFHPALIIMAFGGVIDLINLWSCPGPDNLLGSVGIKILLSVVFVFSVAPPWGLGG